MTFAIVSGPLTSLLGALTSVASLAQGALHALPSLLLSFIGISFLVGIHELGHFFACKLFGVHTPSFSIGFGPQLFTKRIGTTDFSFSLLPLGGYVEIAGLQEVGQGEQLEAYNRSNSSFTAKPYHSKMIILFGGIIVNILFAYILLTGMLMSSGLPSTGLLMSQTTIPLIASVLPDSPAEKAGLMKDDRIVAINGQTLAQDQPVLALLKALKAHAGEVVTIDIERGKDTATMLSMPVTLNSTTATTQLGVAFAAHRILPQTLTHALYTSGSIIYTWMAETFKGIRTMLQKRTTQGLGGPIAVIHGIAQSAHHGMLTFLLSLCFISVGLACLNIIPLPIFDGGQAVFYTLEAIAGRSLEAVRILIHYVCWALVLVAMIYLSWHDIVRIITAQ